MNDLDWIQDAAMALRSEVEVELDHHAGRPDLADVLARARAIDQDAVPEGLGLPDGDTESADDDGPLDPELAVFASALRDEIEDDVEDRAMQPVVAPPGQTARRRPWGVWLAVAAAVVAIIGFASLGSSAQSHRLEETPASMASKSLEDLTENGAWIRAAPEPVVRKQRTPSATPVVPPTEASPQPVLEPEPGPSPEGAGQTWKRVARPKRPSLDALESEAMTAWKAGDLDRAESLFRTIIRRAGRGTKAELAYGDLFALEKQRGGAAKQAKIWRQYLRRFPNGRYADDARAGLCVRTSGESASACWADYLSKHPRGAHVKQAQRATP